MKIALAAGTNIPDKGGAVVEIRRQRAQKPTFTVENPR